MLKVLFVEMSVNVVFVKLFEQYSEFNSCQRMALYKKIAIKKVLLLLTQQCEQYKVEKSAAT